MKSMKRKKRDTDKDSASCSRFDKYVPENSQYTKLLILTKLNKCSFLVTTIYCKIVINKPSRNVCQVWEKM
jgi:hypothetical protein